MRNYIALALVAASTSAVMLRDDATVVEAAVTEVAEATGCTKGEVRDQVEKRIDGADGDVETAVKEAKAEFDGEKGSKGSKPSKNEEAQQEADAAAVEEEVEKVARKIENGEEPSEEDKENFKRAAKDAGASEEDIDEAVEMIEGGDSEGLKKKAKKCHKGGEDDGEDKPEKPEMTAAAQQEADAAAVEEEVEKVARKIENGEEPSEEDKENFKRAAKQAGASEADIDEAVELIEDGDFEGLKKKAKKCHKGGEESEGDDDEDRPAKEDGEDRPAKEDGEERPAKEDGEERPAKDGESKPEETVEAQEDAESTDEDKPRRHRKCLADAAGELADELNLTEGEKEDLKALFEEGDWEAFEEGADIVGDENAEKLFNKLDGAEVDFEADEAEFDGEKPAKGDRPSKDGEAPAQEE